jgi:two-component system chemotaxis sensor kinase CheA
MAALQNPETLKAQTLEKAEAIEEEIPAEASASIQAVAQAPKAKAPVTDDSIRVNITKVEKLLNFVGELVILQTVLREQSQSTNPMLLRKTVHQIGKVTKEVQDISMSLRMVPLKQTFQKMQRIVRDTANVLGKQANLMLIGEETELDKTVLEKISDPLVHMIRNAVDHGLESSADRIAAGKDEAGMITLSAFHQGGKLVIEVNDDGAGIDPEKLRLKAIEKGILRAEDKLTEQELIHLIFHPGFSTKAAVTEVSGRGVGMDVVKTNIELLQGEVIVNSVKGKGTVFRVYLPLTLAIIDGMVVLSEENRFVVPLSQVHESVRPAAEDVRFATGLGETLLLRGETLPVHRLSGVFGTKRDLKPAHESIALVVRTGGKPFAVLVDDILGQQQIVIKKLGSEIQNLRGISGSAILGDGKPALILELTDLENSKTTYKGAIA